ncbi:MAG: hypothetical protein ACXVRH_13220 [Thermoleophilaceae bacterium]
MAVATRTQSFPPPPEAPPRAARLDRFDLLVLVAFAAISLWVLGLDLWQVIVNGKTWTGGDGIYVVDQLQYVSWINDVSHHLLASNRFVLQPTPHDYLQPGVEISGLLAALGVVPWLALILWKPVAVGAGYFAVRGFTRRCLEGRDARRVALVLGLFFASFSVIYGSFGVVGDLLPGFLTWGYPFALMAVAATVFGLLEYDRVRVTGRRIWLPGLLGAVASALHPWQGEAYALILIGAEIVSFSGWESLRSRLRPLLITLVLTGLPLVYFLILGHSDPSWMRARDASKHSFALSTILLGIAPLLIPALFAYRRRPRNFVALTARVWPVAALVIYLLSATALSATPLHAFDGISIPLAVLAVEAVQHGAWRRVPRPRLVAVLLVAVLTLPATLWVLGSARELAAPTVGNSNFITHDERRALDFLDQDPQPGGVLTRFYLGTTIPAETQRSTFVGHCLWSEPDCTGRARDAQALFDGTLDGAQARSFVRATGARFVLADCQTSADLTRMLAPITRQVRRFGCASVYTVD